jgi:hypothetical protein
LKTVQVVATYLRADGTPLQGTVSFHPPSPLVSGTSNALVSGDVVATIQPDGTITATLVACDDPSISPANFTYQVSEAFTNAQGRTYNVSLSYLASQPIDLMPVTPSSPNAGNVTYVAGPGVPSGGAAGTLLFKNSVTDYDTSWKTPAAAGVLPLSGGTMTGSVTSVGSSSNSIAEQNQVTGDANPRWQQLASGYMAWGPGNTAGDTNLYRGAVGVLKTDNSLTVLTRLGVGQDAPSVSTIAATTTTDQNAIKLTNTAASGNLGSSSILSIAQTSNSRALGYKVGSESQNRWGMLHDGSMLWGPGGNTSPDTNLYRSAVGYLTTDTALTVGTTLSVGGTGSFGGALSVSSQVSGVSLKASGSTGAANQVRLVGANTSGAPTSGTWQAGDLAADLTGNLFVCIASGTPGTWVGVSGGVSNTAWTAYTPTWTGQSTAPAIGSGSIVGYYSKVGRTVTARIGVYCAANTTFGGGAYSFSLPFAAAVAGAATADPAHTGLWALSNNATFYTATAAILQSSPSTVMGFYNGSGTFFGNGTPVTWTAATGTWFVCTITYESTT